MMNPNARFVVETLLVWVFFCLPINILTLFLRAVAPPFVHETAGNGTAAAAAAAAEDNLTDLIFGTNIDDTEKFFVVKDASSLEMFSNETSLLANENTLLSLCIFLMVAVSSERCQAICHPLRERPSPRSYLLSVTLVAVSLNARKFFEFQMNVSGDDYETTSIMEYPTYIIISSVWQELFVTGVMPFLALVYCNIRIYCKIRESSKHEKHRFVGGGGGGGGGGCGGGGETMMPVEEYDIELSTYPHPQQTATAATSPDAKEDNGSANGGSGAAAPGNGAKSDDAIILAVPPQGKRKLRPSQKSSGGQMQTPLHKGGSEEISRQFSPRVRSRSPFTRRSSFFGRKTLGIGGSSDGVRGNSRNKAALSPPSRPASALGRSSNSISLNGYGHHIRVLDKRTAAAASEAASAVSSPHHRGRGSGKANAGGGGGGGTVVSRGQRLLRKRHEKSVLILVLIVFVFLVCHSFRLGVQTFQTLHSKQSTKNHYDFCLLQERSHFPATFLILISFNNLFLVLNSSINFIIYCAVRKTFRHTIFRILRCSRVSHGGSASAVGGVTAHTNL